MPDSGLDRRRLPAAALAAGALLLALGAGLALARLPEWRLGRLPAGSPAGSAAGGADLPGRQLLEREFAAIAARCGLRLAGAGPRVEIVETSRRRRTHAQMPMTSTLPDAALAFRVEQQAAPGNSAGTGQTLRIWFDAGARPQAIEWKVSDLSRLINLVPRAGSSPAGLAAAFGAALLAPSEHLGPPVPMMWSGIPLDLYDIAGARPVSHVTRCPVPTCRR